jgi:hypothetical protein
MLEFRQHATKTFAEIKSRFEWEITSFMLPPMSENEITFMRNQEVSKILDGDTNPTHIKALNTSTEGYLVPHRKVTDSCLYCCRNSESFLQYSGAYCFQANKNYTNYALVKVSNEVNLKASTTLNELVRATVADSNDLQWATFEEMD